MSSQSSSWIPGSANASLWHQVRARAELGARGVGDLLPQELARIIDPSIAQIPYQQIPRLAGYLKGLNLDSVEHLDAQSEQVLGSLVRALVENPEIWPLARALWQAEQDAAVAGVRASGRRKTSGEGLVPMPRSARTLLLAFATYLDRTHLEHARLEERHFSLLLKDALAWPSVELRDPSEGFHPTAANTLQAWAVRQLLKAGDLQALEDIDAGVDKATQSWVATLPEGTVSGDDERAVREDIALSLFTVQPKICSQAYPVSCLWRWRWLQNTPARATSEMLRSAARNLANVPAAVLVHLGITRPEAAAMTTSPDGAARSVGLLISGATKPLTSVKGSTVAREKVPAGELSATAAWGKTAQTMRR